MTKVIVIAGSAVSQAGLESVLRTAPHIEVTASFSESRNLLPLLEAYAADVILVEELNLDPLNWQQVAELAREDPPPAMVVLTHATERNRLSQMLAVGIRGLLPYSAAAAEIIVAVQAVAEGLMVIHEDYRSDLFQRDGLSRPGGYEAPMEPLTTREVEILALLSQGLTNKAIATGIHLSEHTVKFHIGMIFEKLQVSSRTEAVAIGIRQGLVML